MDKYRITYMINGYRAEDIIITQSSIAAAEILRAKFPSTKITIISIRRE